eukprot:TRINITY_DN14365_c0_g1_i2.p1 TRINITY_DN14365_c0_g1~~TRINITY_DN14365_c0_g1_i2.p1  ORF type:complete len:165 (-),score=48.42 TRINITY_DN14365_c0_g1_i2:64-558(-)
MNKFVLFALCMIVFMSFVNCGKQDTLNKRIKHYVNDLNADEMEEDWWYWTWYTTYYDTWDYEVAGWIAFTVFCGFAFTFCVIVGILFCVMQKRRRMRAVTYVSTPARPNTVVYQQQQPAYNQAPPAYNQAPPAYNQNPPAYNQNPPAYNQNPPAYNQAPPPYKG